MRRKMMRVLIIISLIAFFAGGPSAASAQCAMCKKSAENANSNDDTAIASTLNQGVLYLLALPYVAGGVLGVIWYRNNKIQNA